MMMMMIMRRKVVITCNDGSIQITIAMIMVLLLCLGMCGVCDDDPCGRHGDGMMTNPRLIVPMS